MAPLKTNSRWLFLSVFRGAIRLPSQRTSKTTSAFVAAVKPVSAVALVLLLAVTGCGEEGGVDEGATVTVYVAAGACSQAQRVLENEGGRVDSLRIRAICLPSVKQRGRFDLARVGANARRANEDSSTIAYIGELEPTAVRFSETILEEADIAQLPEMSGSAAMQKILNALGRVDTSSGSLREAVNDELQ